MMTDDEWRRFKYQLSGRTAGDTVRLKLALLDVQGDICPLCGLPIKGVGTLEHVIPRSAGGADRLGNFVCSHHRCNARKADRMPTGCELVWLLAVNARLGVEPQRW